MHYVTLWIYGEEYIALITCSSVTNTSTCGDVPNQSVEQLIHCVEFWVRGKWARVHCSHHLRSHATGKRV